MSLQVKTSSGLVTISDNPEQLTYSIARNAAGEIVLTSSAGVTTKVADNNTTYTFTESNHVLTITGSDGTTKDIQLGEEVTKSIVETALGYTPLQASDIESKVDKVEGSSLISSTDLAQIGTNKTDISTLKGTGDGSIDKMIDDKINTWATALTDDGTVNSYAEAINWIATHASDYTTLLGDVANKVDKVSGKGLSTEDFTTALKTKLEGLNPTDTYSATGTDPVTGKAVASAISDKADKATTLAGYGITDAATSTQGATADSAVQSVKIGDTEYKNGTTVTLPAYPTTLPASDVKDWAKADEKPSYTYTEVGAAASSHAHASNEINALTGYEIASTSGAISATDTLNTALGKIEKALSEKQGSGSYAASDHNHDDVYYTESEMDTKLSGKLDTSLKGAANGLAELDADGKVPASQLPSYVDDVIEYDELTNFPETGESGKVYIAKNTNITYRWSGTTYVPIGSDLALGETESTAYRGDRGKTAYDHSQADHARVDATKVEASETNGNIKIDGTETTVYTHPTTTGNNHIPTGGAYGQSLVYSDDGTAKWGNTTHSLNSAVVSDDGNTIRYNYTDGSYEILTVIGENDYIVDEYDADDNKIISTHTVKDSSGNITITRS